jgi:hypothetical protein
MNGSHRSGGFEVCDMTVEWQNICLCHSVALKTSQKAKRTLEGELCALAVVTVLDDAMEVPDIDGIGDADASRVSVKADSARE